MEALFAFLIALFAAILLVPLATRYAGILGFIDTPDERKVHDTPVPRSGGIALVVAATLAVGVTALVDRTLAHLAGGALVIVLLGMWDDRAGLSYKIKFFGQFAAVAVVLSGGIVIEHIPFLGREPLPASLAYPLTAIFLVAITNAVNLSDGLDGLAGGISIATLTVLAILGYLADADGFVLLTLALMGATLGFLRYNTHPATVFLGDTGSQFLGFSIAGLTIILIEQAHPAVSPALPLLLLGIPIIDTIWVMGVRIRAGRSPFSPDDNHLHHRLLMIGLNLGLAVGAIYVLHGALAFSALGLLYAADGLIIGIFGAFGVGLIGGLVALRKVRLAADTRDDADVKKERRWMWLRRRAWLPRLIVPLLSLSLGAFLVGGSVVIDVSPDVGAASLVLLGLVVIGLIFVPTYSNMFGRVALYVSSVFIIYYLAPYSGVWLAVDVLINGFVALILVITLIGIRIGRRSVFQINPKDFIIFLFAVVVPAIAPAPFQDFPVSEAAFRLIVFFYAIEVLVLSQWQHYRHIRFHTGAKVMACGVLAIVGLQGLLPPL